MQPRIVALAGGVGGSRFARGLKVAAPEADLTVVVNTGDDVTLHGLRISPDVDTVLYALSGLVDEKRGWGPRGDTFLAMDALERLGGETWFRLGDMDLATHLRRTGLLQSGWTPSRITREFAQRLGIAGVTILPMTDSPVETWVQLVEDGGWVHFQEYFVHRRTDVPICAVEVRGISAAVPAPGVLEAVDAADLVVICPSNPFVSVNPILQVPGVGDIIAAARRRKVLVAAVSPLIGGATVKGPDEQPHDLWTVREVPGPVGDHVERRAVAQPAADPHRSEPRLLVQELLQGRQVTCADRRDKRGGLGMASHFTSVLCCRVVALWIGHHCRPFPAIDREDTATGEAAVTRP